MNKFLLLLSYVFLVNCLSNSRYNNNCTMDNVNKTGNLNVNTSQMSLLDSNDIPKDLGRKADKIMVENGYILNDLKRSISFNNNYYYVRYAYVKRNSLGGGGSLVFDTDIKLVSKCFEE